MVQTYARPNIGHDSESIVILKTLQPITGVVEIMISGT